jgi:hypothetical protein
MIDLSNLKTTNPGKKTNPDTVSYGTKDGKIYFGYLYPGNIKVNSSSAIAGVHLQGYHSLHYMSLIKNGPMQGTTINRSPGPYNVVCATEHAGEQGKTEGIGYLLFAENGDIVIRAPNGRVRISGMDVDIKAEGTDNTRGSINLDSNQSVNIKTGSFDMKATLGAKFFTTRNIDIVANTSLSIISNFTKGLTTASTLRPAKGVPIEQSTLKYTTSQDYN